MWHRVVCPVAATGMGHEFLCRLDDGTLFDGRGLGRDLKHALETIGINTGSCSPHNFGIGTTTEEAQMGIRCH